VRSTAAAAKIVIAAKDDMEEPDDEDAADGADDGIDDVESLAVLLAILVAAKVFGHQRLVGNSSDDEDDDADDGQKEIDQRKDEIGQKKVSTPCEDTVDEQAVDDEDEEQADDAIVDVIGTCEHADHVEQTQHKHDDTHNFGSSDNVHMATGAAVVMLTIVHMNAHRSSRGG